MSEIVIVDEATEEETPLNISGSMVRYTLCKSLNDDVAVWDLKVYDHIDPINGKSETKLTALETSIEPGSYYLVSAVYDSEGERMTLNNEMISIVNTPKIWRV
jgi:hypothetical protein